MTFYPTLVQGIWSFVVTAWFFVTQRSCPKSSGVHWFWMKRKQSRMQEARRRPRSQISKRIGRSRSPVRRLKIISANCGVYSDRFRQVCLVVGSSLENALPRRLRKTMMKIDAWRFANVFSPSYCDGPSKRCSRTYRHAPKQTSTSI